ncbi:MAG: hypothetical protein ACM32F_06090 [Betaproteobacteria bacterium]
MAKRAARSVKASVAVPVPRPRNPLAMVARRRAAGVHGPTRKAERVAARVRLKKAVDEA